MVNVAARLEQAAAPGEILLGAQTYALIREAVRADALEPLELKGKTERVPACARWSADVPAFTGADRGARSSAATTELATLPRRVRRRGREPQCARS